MKGALLRKIKEARACCRALEAKRKLLELIHLRVGELGGLYSNSPQSLGPGSLALPSVLSTDGAGFRHQARTSTCSNEMLVI